MSNLIGGDKMETTEQKSARLRAEMKTRLARLTNEDLAVPSMVPVTVRAVRSTVKIGSTFEDSYNYQEPEEIQGHVKSFGKNARGTFGVFVEWGAGGETGDDLYDLDEKEKKYGLLHASQVMVDGEYTDVRAHFDVGDKIKVVILEKTSKGTSLRLAELIGNKVQGGTGKKKAKTATKRADQLKISQAGPAKGSSAGKAVKYTNPAKASRQQRKAEQKKGKGKRKR